MPTEHDWNDLAEKAYLKQQEQVGYVTPQEFSKTSPQNQSHWLDLVKIVVEILDDNVNSAKNAVTGGSAAPWVTTRRAGVDVPVPVVEVWGSICRIIRLARIICSQNSQDEHTKARVNFIRERIDDLDGLEFHFDSPWGEKTTTEYSKEPK